MYDIEATFLCYSLVLKYMLTAHFLYFSLVSRKDSNFEATRLHFENLVKRYGHPIIILNLIKVGISTYVRNHRASLVSLSCVYTKRFSTYILFFFCLFKTREKKPRETILRAEFANAVRSLNKNLKGENRLRFLHWDLHRHSRW